MKALEKIDAVIEKIQVGVCIILFAAMVILGSVQILSRFVFNNSTTWTDEMIRFFCIWLTFIGSALTIRRDGHVSIDLLQSALHNTRVKVMLFVLARLACVLFLIMIIPGSIELVMKSQNSMASSIKLSFSVVYLSIPVGAVMMLLSYINAIPFHVNKIKEEAK